MPLGLGYGVPRGGGERVASVIGGGEAAMADVFVWRHDNGDNTFEYRYATAANFASPTSMIASWAQAGSSLQGGVFHPGTGWLVFPIYGGSSNVGTVEVYDVATGVLTDLATNHNIAPFGADVRDVAVPSGTNTGVRIVAMYSAGDDQLLGWTDESEQTGADFLIENYANVDHEGLAIVEEGIGTTADLDVYFNFDNNVIAPRVGGFDLLDDRNADFFFDHEGQGSNQSHLIIGISPDEWSGEKGLIVTVADEDGLLAGQPELAAAYVDGTGSTANMIFPEITGTIQGLTHNYNGSVYVYDSVDGLHRLTLSDSAGNPVLTYAEQIATLAQCPTLNGRQIICVPEGTTITVV